MKEQWKQFLSGSRALPLLLIGIGTGLLLIFLGNSQNAAAVTENASVSDEAALNQTAEDWARMQEAKISALLLTMSDVRTVSVAVTPESGSEYYYAQDGTTDDTAHTKQYVVIDRNGEMPVLVHEICPKLRGIAVVAPGIRETTAYEIINLLSALYDLSTNHIYVSG